MVFFWIPPAQSNRTSVVVSFCSVGWCFHNGGICLLPTSPRSILSSGCCEGEHWLERRCPAPPRPLLCCYFRSMSNVLSAFSTTLIMRVVRLIGCSRLDKVIPQWSSTQLSLACYGWNRAGTSLPFGTRSVRAWRLGTWRAHLRTTTGGICTNRLIAHRD